MNSELNAKIIDAKVVSYTDSGSYLYKKRIDVKIKIMVSNEKERFTEKICECSLYPWMINNIDRSNYIINLDSTLY